MPNPLGLSGEPNSVYNQNHKRGLPAQGIKKEFNDVTH